MNAAAQTETITWRRGLLGRLILLAVVVLLIGQVVVAWLAVDSFERDLEPQLDRKIQVVGHAVADQISFAVDDLGIPPNELVGMDAFFDKVLADNPDIEYLVLQAPSLSTPFARGLSSSMLARILPELSATTSLDSKIADFTNGAFPLTAVDLSSPVLHVGVSNEYVRSRLSEIIYEVITVIVVSWLVTLEFLMFFMSARISGPMERIEKALMGGAKGRFTHRLAMRARDEIGQVMLSFNQMLRNLEQRYEDFHFESHELEGAQIDTRIAERIRKVREKMDERFRFTDSEESSTRNALQIRVPLFLFIFSEELSRSFLPLFIARLSPESAIGNDLLIGLPITLFMLAATLVTMIGAGFADRFGARRVFLAGITTAVVGYIGTFLVQGYYDMVAWRILTGIGYGLTFIAAQAWVTENTGEDNRAQSMAVFVGAVFVGTVCGPSIGGIFANRIGFEATFLVSAGLAMIAALIVYRVLQDGNEKTTSQRVVLSFKEWWLLLSDTQFFAVTVFSAVSGKFILTGFLFYLVPLYLSELDNSQSAIGRIMMLYGVATIVCASLAARFADRAKQYPLSITVGGLLAAAGCFAVLVEGKIGGATNAVIITTVTLGVSHAMSLTSQLAIIQQVADRHHGIIGRASVIGAYRLVERVGMILGPMVAGILVAAFGYAGAVVGIGVIALISVAGYMTLMVLTKSTFALPQRKST